MIEWNVKVTKKDLPETIDKIAATFESYWNSSEFEYYSEDQKERLARALRAEKYIDGTNPEVYTMDIMPYSYQQEILDKLEAERKVRGYNRNLVVAATGTGKTVISALDYKRFRKQNPGRPCRLLFVAHREEILKQSLYTFRAVLKDANFGEMFVGSYKPDSIENLFISIQTFNSQDFTAKTNPDYYDYIIVVAMDFMKPATVREGVKWLPEKQLDVFFVTLNKSDKDYSPTTMYNDYSINETLFHWQSQSTTAADSPTGQRYINHRSKGTKVLLFVREFKSDRITGGAEAYTYLGNASYVTHSGSKPMNITWKLDRPIPAKYLKKTNKLVVG